MAPVQGYAGRYRVKVLLRGKVKFAVKSVYTIIIRATVRPL